VLVEDIPDGIDLDEVLGQVAELEEIHVLGIVPGDVVKNVGLDEAGLNASPVFRGRNRHEKMSP
jgi:hypothetical protein